MPTPPKAPLVVRFMPNNGRPLKNAELATVQNLPTRRERREALRHVKKKLTRHVKSHTKRIIIPKINATPIQDNLAAQSKSEEVSDGSAS